MCVLPSGILGAHAGSPVDGGTLARRQSARSSASGGHHVVSQEIDRKRVQEFARQVFGLYTGGVLTLMIELGYRNGLFEAAAQGSATSDELAARAGLDERYVREWLGAMATGGVFDYDAATGRFTLPAEHAQVLTGPSSRNLAPGSQTLRMLATRLPAVAECFRQGGGVPYSAFRPDFTEAMDASWRRIYDGLLIKAFLPLVIGVPERLQSGISVADVGCGTGHAVNVMAREYPRSTFVGFDLGEEAIARAHAEASAMGLANARFERLDATTLPTDPKFDLITSFDAIHDQRDPAAALRRIAGALATAGLYLLLEPRDSAALHDNHGQPLGRHLHARR